MTIQFHLHGLNANSTLRTWLEKQLERLQRLIPVSAADVRLERRSDCAPPYCAEVHLAVPGPDIHATAQEHTLEAVWLKVARKLRQQIERRQAQQKTRRKNQQQPLLSAGRWSGVFGQRT